MTATTFSGPAVVAAPSSANRRRLRKGGLLAVSVGFGLLCWQLLAVFFGPSLVSSPGVTAEAAWDLTRDGTLPQAVGWSLLRIMVGWTLGVIVGVPLGVAMGRITIVRELLDPYIEFFRFIPPIAFVTLAVVWFGIGETSKIVLIFYTSVFIVTINTMAGALSVEESRIRAAISLGARPRQVLTSVVLPSTVPFIVTGARLAMGNSFLTIVSAEIVAARFGLGALIWTSRNYGRIDWIFVGIAALGLLGYVVDRVIRLVVRRWLSRYNAVA